MDKNKRYKIGLIIPTYNDLEELKKFIFKINKNFKVLVINDCSIDQTKKYLDLLNDKQISSLSLAVVRIIILFFGANPKKFEDIIISFDFDKSPPIKK